MEGLSDWIRDPAARWDRVAAVESGAAPLLDMLAESVLDCTGVLAGQHVLDVGAGDGRASLLSAARGANVVGVDLAPRAIAAANARAEERALPACFIPGDATALPFADASFDVAFCLRSLWTFGDPALALQEMYRVLRPGGRLVVQLWGPPAGNSFLTLGGGILGARIEALRVGVGELGPFDLDPEWAAAALRARATVRSATHQESVPSAAYYWNCYRTLAGTAWVCRQDQTPEIRASMDDEWLLRARRYADANGHPILSLDWRVCAWFKT